MFTQLKSILFFLIIFSLQSCATYYDKSRATEQALITGDYESAAQNLQKNKFLKKKRNLMLYNLEMGKVSHLRGQYDSSNTYFNEADRLMEEFYSFAEMAVGVTVNPSLQPYKAEYHEQIMMHYYKSLNYLQLGNLEEALVEARRINLKNNAQEIKVNDNDRKYSDDPFGLMLMGMIYEANHDYNNAFIAYRNAKAFYEKDHSGMFAPKQPAHLEADILRCATKSGIFYDSDLANDPNYAANGELILFYESGLSPVKAEKNYFFSLDQNSDGFFFQSENLIVPVDYNFNNVDPDFNPDNLGLIRLAFPYYVSRSIEAEKVLVNSNGQNIEMELVEDISAIAFQIEKNNFFKNLGRDLIRITIKKLSEMALAEKSEAGAIALNIANTATEKADTRNWQTLPGQIQFVRIPLNKGINTISVTSNDGTTHKIEVEGTGQMVFKNVCAY
ncbi:MAG: hypothetical protein IPO32_18980 [Crocinitomicaceae bacterium]|nr:hypothetical protein [Crocinitomicaceae bacterium]MBK9593488.1 hypothetical protein [Crocinitomicaceae bacterium]